MKTILVTGASSGFGAATVQRYASEGWRVIAWARRMDRLTDWKSSLSTTQQALTWIQEVDVRDPKAVTSAIASLPAEFSDVDLLINNAGLAAGKDPVHTANLDDWERMIDTNLKGLLYVTRAISPKMVARKTGHIINIGSIAGKESYPEGNAYNATKYAVDGTAGGKKDEVWPKLFSLFDQGAKHLLQPGQIRQMFGPGILLCRGR